MPSQEIQKIGDGPFGGGRNFDIPKKKKRVARILVFKIRSSQEILKIRDGTPLEAEGILTYRKSPRNCSVWHFSSKLDVPSNVLQKKRVARILVFKIRPSQEILKIRDGTPLEAEGILTYRKRPSKLPEPSQEILKIRDGTPLEAEGILTYRKRPSKLPEILKIRDGTPLEMPSQEIQKIGDGPFGGGRNFDIPKKALETARVARILVFKIRPSQEILKIRDGTPLEAEGILTYKKSPRNCSVWHFSSKLDVPSNVLQKKRVARILVFKIRQSQEILKIRDGTPLEAEEILTYRKRPSQEILKIRDGTPLEAEGILTYRKGPQNCSVWHFSSKPSQEILKIRDGTPLEAEGILTYRKSPRNCSGWHFSSKLDVPSNLLQKKIVARILVFKIRPSQEILKIRDGTPLEAEGIFTYRKRPSKLLVAQILVFKIRPSQEILKIRDGTPLEADGILTYRKSPRNCSVWHFSSKLDVPSNVLQKKRVARILVFKIRPSQEILKIRDGTPLEAEGILTYRKSPRNCSVWHLSSKLDVPSNVLQKKRVARILVFKIRPSQEILKIRDGTPLEAEGIFTYRKRPSKLLVAQILVFKIRPSQEILKIRDGTPLEADGILTYRKSPRNCSVWHFSSKLDVPSNVLQKKRVARILVFKIRPSQEILKIRDGTPLEAEGILTYRKRPSQEILKIRDGTPLEADGILTYRKSPRNCSVWHFSSKLDVPSNVLQKKRVARILVFKIRPSQEILKIRDGTPLEAEGILTYRKSPRNCSVWHFSSKLDVPSNVLQKKRVARILVFKIRPSQEIQKIGDGTPLEADGILTYRKSPRNCTVWHFSSKLDVPSNVLQKKRVARILVFKIRPSQEILKIRDGTPLEGEGILTYRRRPSKLLEIQKIGDGPFGVARILVFKIRSSQEILKIRDGTPLEAEGILTYRKSPRNCSVWHFSSKLDVPSNVLQKKRVARILVFKIRQSQEILKIRDGTPLEAEEILTYRKRPSKLLEKRVARILVFKIRPSQEIQKIGDGTPLEADGILTYRKSPRNCTVWHFSSKLDVPSNVLQKKRVARILVFKIRPSQEILKIRDGTPLEAEGILTSRRRPSKLLE
ncbi:hypothetical protein OROMI_025724 [Orobanche minor]